MEIARSLKVGGKPLESLPSIGDDVDFEVEGDNPHQSGHFEAVETLISSLGNGQTATLAKGQADQLNESVKGVDLKEATRMSEEQFGRKLYKNVKTMFQFVLGNVMLAIVESNYPIDRFIERRNEVIAKLQVHLDSVQDTRLTPLKPDKDIFELRKRLDWDEKVKKKTDSRKLRSAAKAKSGAVTGDDSATEQSGATEQSLSDVEESKEEFEKEIDKQYLAAYQRWRSFAEKDIENKASAELAKKEVGKVTVLVTILEGIRTAMSSITSKIKSAVKDHEKVKQKLMCMVTLKSTGESIPNPLENNNLSGLYEILKLEYAEATLVRFNTDLQTVMKTSITQEELHKNPTKAVQLTDEALAVWMSMDYWNFMTQDVFFTNILLMAMPSSQFQIDCVKEVQKFVEGKGNGMTDHRDDSSVSTAGVSKDFPMYNHLKQYIKRCEESARHSKALASGFSRKPSSYGGGSGGGKYGNVETAAMSGTEYTTEIGRDKQLKCKDVTTGVEYPYTATKEKCSKCSARSADKHSPGCYLGTCNKCKLFGHKAAACSQAKCTFVQNASS